jgi:hypothetical protein
MGKMSFLRAGMGEELGDECRVMVVMTVMAMLEARRRNENNAAAGAGIAAAVTCC